MKIFKQIKQGITRSVYKMGLSDYAAMKNLALNFGAEVSNENAIRFTAVYAAIRLRSENIASMPRYIQKTDAQKGVIDVPNHPVSRVISIEPNSYTNTFDFWNAINAGLDGWGNAYALIERAGNGDVKALHQIHPSYVDVFFSFGKKYYRVTGDNDHAFLNGVYLSHELCHFMLVTFDGIRGVDPITYNAGSIGEALASQAFSNEFYKKGGNIKGVLETERDLGDVAYTNFLKHYKEAAQNFTTPLLEYGIKYKNVGISPIAAQLLQSKTFSIQEIARIFNVPPHLLAELSHATFSNIEHQNTQFAVNSLRPAVKRYEVEIENKLFFEGERGQFSAKFDLRGMLRGDSAARSAYYHNAILDGWMSRNDVRELEGYSRVDGLDNMMFPLNAGIIENGKVKSQQNEK